MNGRVYTVVVSGVASPATTFDFFELIPATGKPLRLRRILITQTSEPTTEEEQIALTVSRGNTTSGSGGSTPTPSPVCPTDAASGFTVETMNTTIATAGTEVKLVETAWNTRAGLDLAFAPEECPEVGATGATLDRLLVRSAAPTDAVTIRATCWVEELG